MYRQSPSDELTKFGWKMQIKTTANKFSSTSLWTFNENEEKFSKTYRTQIGNQTKIAQFAHIIFGNHDIFQFYVQMYEILIVQRLDRQQQIH